MLTNEQYAEFIQQGNVELKPVLWDRVKKYIYVISDRYYTRNSFICTRCGLTSADLRQQAYIAYNASFDTYEPERGEFVNFLAYAYKNAVRGLLGRSDALNRAEDVSLDSAIDDTSDDAEKTLLDYLEDETASEPFESIDFDSVKPIIHNAVDSLPEKQSTAINQVYFEGKTAVDIARSEGVSAQCVSLRIREGFNSLRKNPDLIKLADEYGYNSSRAMRNTLGAFNRTGITGVEQVAIKRADAETDLYNQIKYVGERLDYWKTLAKQDPEDEEPPKHILTLEKALDHLKQMIIELRTASGADFYS